MKQVFQREWLLLAGILLFSFFFRVRQIDTVFFGPEQAWIAQASWRLANLQDFPTHMHVSSAGYSLLPLPIYLTFIPYLFSDSPYALLIHYTLLNLIPVGLCWWFTRRYGGLMVAALATVVYACMPWAIHFSLRVWINTLLPPFVMIWAIGCALAFAERRPRWTAFAWGMAWLALQLHISAVFLLLITFIMTWQHREARRWRYALLGSGLGLLPAVPWLYAQMVGTAQLGLDFGTATGQTAPGIHIQGLMDFLSARGLATSFIAAQADALADRLSYRGVAAALWLVLFGMVAAYGIGKVWRGWRQSNERARLHRFLALWCLLPLAYTLVSAERYTIVFFLPLLPAPCILLALAIQETTQQFRGSKAAMFTLVFVLSGLNLNTVRLLDRALEASVAQGNAMSHKLAADYFTYPPPLEWQLELVEHMQAVFAAGEATELILLAEAYPDEDSRRFAWTYSYHLGSPEVRVINLYAPHLVYPAQPAVILQDTFLNNEPPGFGRWWHERARLGPYRIYLLPGGAGPEPQIPLLERPAYDNGLTLLGYDELSCDGNWRLHWTPEPGGQDAERAPFSLFPLREERVHAHFFVHLLDAEGEGLAQRDLRVYDERDWRAGDHMVTRFDFGRELQDLPIETIRVGLYSYSEKTESFQEGIYALDEQGRPWEYAVDIPYEGSCSL